MNGIATLEQLLFQVSSALYVPVVLGCLFLLIYVPIQAGITLREACQRRRHLYAARERFKSLLAAEVEAHRHSPRTLDIRAQRLLQQEELALTRRFDRVRSIIRIGPALGLMGALIPTGISLAALAEGNILKLAENMATALPPAVAGLGAGVASYLLSLVRERWLQEDVREMACSAELFIAWTRDGSHGSEFHAQESVDEAVTCPA